MSYYARKLRPSLKRSVIRTVAVFFVMYALADVTVLQVYCGNEFVGVPPEHHSSHHKSEFAHVPAEACSDSDQVGCQQAPDDHGYDHSHQCFYWQQVGVESYNFNPGLIATVHRSKLPASYDDSPTSFGVSCLFRPPRT